MKYCLLFLLRFTLINMYGTTGLLHASTVGMQKDKTILIDGSMIYHNTCRSNYWKGSREYTHLYI